MTWVRFDDKFHSNAKIISAGNAAVGVYARALTWSSDNLTDGFVPEAVAQMFAGFDGQAVLDRLVTVRLWERVEGGYRAPDYLEYNPSAEKVRAERDAARERMAKHRGGSRDVRPNTSRTSVEVHSPRTRSPNTNTPLPPASGGEVGSVDPPKAASKPESLTLTGEMPAAKGKCDTHAAGITAVFEHWRSVMGKGARAVLSPKRERAVRGRLAEGYTVDELKRAVDGCKNSPHHQGQTATNSTVYDDLELICRDAGKVDMFVAKASSDAREQDENPNNVLWMPAPKPAPRPESEPVVSLKGIAAEFRRAVGGEGGVLAAAGIRVPARRL